MLINSKTPHKRFILFILWLLWAGAYLLLIGKYVFRPILGWEFLTWRMAQSIHQGSLEGIPIVFHFPLDASLIALHFSFFGVSELSARLPGIVCALLMPLVIYFLSKQISDEKGHVPIAAIASLLFFTLSPVIQGFLTINLADTTIFSLFISLFYLLLIKSEVYPFWPRCLILAVLYALCFFSKMTTSLAPLVAVPLAYLLNNNLIKGVKISLAVFIPAALMICIVWGLVCYLFFGFDRLMQPFSYYAPEASKAFFTFSFDKLIKIALDIFRIYLWLSPLFLLLAILAVSQYVKGFFKKSVSIGELHLVVFVLVVFFSYLYANATFSSFPKYIIPVLPMLSCLIAKCIYREIGFLFNSKGLFIFISLIFIGVMYYFSFVGDWVYPIYLLRKAQLNNSLSEVFMIFAKQQILFFVFPLAVFVTTRFLRAESLAKRLIYALLISVLASNIALNLVQRKAHYSLNYAYGAEGADSLKVFLGLRAPLRVYTTAYEGYIANAGNIEFKGISFESLHSPENFLAFMKEKEPEALLYGLPVNTIVQVKAVFRDSRVIAYLEKNYQQFAIGSYNVLIRKKET